MHFVVAKRLLSWRLEGLRGVLCRTEVRRSEVVFDRKLRQLIGTVYGGLGLVKDRSRVGF
jgi:hypothetical protein